MKVGRWLLMAVLASFTAILMVSSVSGQRLEGANSAVIFDYEVTNDGGILFADEFERLGGVDTLGYPASYRFTLGDGFTYQVTQRALLQWRPEVGAAYLGNIFEMIENAGMDQWLLESKGIPLPIKDDGSNGDWNKAREARLSWLTNEQIKAKYFANPNPDAISDWNEDSAINLYGLPMSMPEKHGPFISQRFQRVAFQLWVDEVAGSPPPGTVIGVLAGDLLKEAGLVPPEGLNVAERPVVVVAPAPAPAQTSKPKSTSTPEPTPEPTPGPAEGAQLSSLSLSDGATLSPAFASDTHAYTASVVYSVENTTVAATPAEGATAGISPKDEIGTADDGHQVKLAVGENPITITVTAGDETTVYTIVVTKGAAAADDTLSKLELNNKEIALSPAFSKHITSYSMTVPNKISSTTVTAQASAAGATAVVKVNGSVNNAVSLPDGRTTTIIVEVTSQDEKATRTYTIAITRRPTAGAGDNTLSSLSLSGIDLVPAFSSAVTSYTATVAYGTDSGQSTDVTWDENADGAKGELQRNGLGNKASGSTVKLDVGRTILTVSVSPRGESSAKRDYLITVTRLDRTKGANADLDELTLTNITLSPEFKPAVTSYTASVPNSVASTKVTAKAADTKSTDPDNTGSKDGGVADDAVAVVVIKKGSTEGDDVPLTVGMNVITVEVTAEDGTTKKTYTISVTKRSTTGNDDATLAALSVVDDAKGTTVVLNPTFSQFVTSYSAAVPYSVSKVKVTATTNRDGAKAETTGESLQVGPNTVTVTVTAENNSTTEVYTITVTRAADVTNDATLSGLTLSRNDKTLIDLSPAFTSGTVDYTATVASTEQKVDLTATTNDDKANSVIKLNGETDQDGKGIQLSYGSGNVITVEVTAQNDTTKRTYTITVTRTPLSSDATLSALRLTTGTGADVVGVTLTPTFSSGVLSYEAAVTAAKVTVSASANDDGAKSVYLFSGSGGIKTNSDGTAEITLNDGTGIITVKVTAEDQLAEEEPTTRDYMITITRSIES